jgi:glycosyltransferase involved in cell wall biosynthesis
MKEKIITFSVIMPCYNSEAYVKDAIESIIKQTYTNWELLIINDGSTDRTMEIINNFACNDKRIRVFTKENGGYCSAVNLGLENLSGDYFLLLGSDDQLSTSLFKELIDGIGLEFPDLISFRTVQFKNGKRNGKRIGLAGSTLFEKAVIAKDTTIKEFEKKYPLNAKICFNRDTSKCFKTAIMGNIRYFGKYGLSSDEVFSKMLSYNATSFASFPVDGYFMTIRSDSLSRRSKSLIATIDEVNLIIKYFDYISKLNINSITEHEKHYLLRFHGIIRSICYRVNIFSKNYKIINQGNTFFQKSIKKYGMYSHINTNIRIFLFSPRIAFLLQKFKRILVKIIGR